MINMIDKGVVDDIIKKYKHSVNICIMVIL